MSKNVFVSSIWFSQKLKTYSFIFLLLSIVCIGCSSQVDLPNLFYCLAKRKYDSHINPTPFREVVIIMAIVLSALEELKCGKCCCHSNRLEVHPSNSVLTSSCLVFHILVYFVMGACTMSVSKISKYWGLVGEIEGNNI